MIKLCIPYVDKKEIRAVVDAIDSGWLTHGPYNKKFEKSFCEVVGVKHAISCNSCTSAILLVLKALHITGEVIIPSFSFTATANAVLLAGAIPRFVDIDYHTCNIDPECIEKAITPKTQAVMVVHFGGQCCQMKKITKIVHKHKLVLIEDSAENLGGTFQGKQAGSFGVGCFSFFPTKNITTGEGGMITTSDDDLARAVKAMMAHGMDSMTFQREKSQMPWFRSAIMPGYNFRMSNILAAIGFEQMKKLAQMNALRRKHSQYLIKELAGVPEIELPLEAKECQHTFQMFTIKLKKETNRDEFVRRLNKKGIGASVHFYPAIHQQAFYRKHPEWISEGLPVTEDVAKRIVTLPMYPGLRKKDLNQIIAAVKGCLV